jgi:hypothetical protein
VLLAEDLLLMMTDDATGRLVMSGSDLDLGLGGANLTELSLLGRVELTGTRDQGRAGRLVVRSQEPTGDPVLDDALRIVAARQGKKPDAAVRPLAKNLRATLYDRLAGAGVLRQERGRVFGVFPTRRWPAADARAEQEVRRLVLQTLLQGTTPDQRTAALVALLHALRAEHKVAYPREHGLAKRELRARGRQIAEPFWSTKALRKAIDAAHSAAASAGAVSSVTS